MNFTSIPNHIVAVASSTFLSFKYARTLGIQGKEWIRYLKKSISLGLCYVGLGIKGNVREAWMAGEAGFFCCAYDVVTDWRSFGHSAWEQFESILSANALEPELRTLAMELYEKEKCNQLAEDGLERGSIALRCTLKLMNCEKAREIVWGNIDKIGRLFQIVDDVLDYEEDVVCGNTNCLISIRRSVYLRQLSFEFGNSGVHRLFGTERSVLTYVIEKARRKAEMLLEAS